MMIAAAVTCPILASISRTVVVFGFITMVM